jgi:hypothetical protein
MDHQILAGILASDLRCIKGSVLRPRPEFDRHRVAFRVIADHGICAHGLNFRSKKAL